MSTQARAKKPVVFVSYSQKDRKVKDRVVTHLKALQIEQIIEDIWDDSRIQAGSDWLQEIKQAMARTSVAILLISADFLTSRFILGREVPVLLKRRKKEGLEVVPVLVAPCPWQEVKWLAKMQVRTYEGKPLPGGRKREAALATIASEIAKLIR